MQRYQAPMEVATETRNVKIVLITEMLGTAPKDPEIYKTFIESKKPLFVTEDESLDIVKEEEKGWTGFRRDTTGIYVPDFMVQGMLKNAADVLQGNLKVIKTKKAVETVEVMKGLKNKINQLLFIYPRHIYLGELNPENIYERSLRAMTMQGPRVTLTRSDFVEAGLEIEFQLKLIPNKVFNWEIVQYLLSYGQFCGLGQFRNGGFGRFNVVEFTDPTKADLAAVA